MKTVRVRLPVLDLAEADQMLELVTDIDGVLAALIDGGDATLEVVLARDANALLVREQLAALVDPLPAAA